MRLPRALAGTVLIGVGITVGNVAVPVVIARDLPHRAGGVLGAYTAAVNIGSMLTIALTVPLAAATGWRFAIAAGASPCSVRSRCGCTRRGGRWRVHRSGPLRARIPPSAPLVAATGRVGADRGVRRPGVLLTTGSPPGCRCCCATSSAWIPRPRARSASVFQIAALVGAFGVPVLLRVLPGPRPVVLIVAAAWAALPLGLLLAPQLWPVWSAVGGAAQGGGITVIFALIVRKARDLAENRHRSALVQAVGTSWRRPAQCRGRGARGEWGWTVPLLVVLAAMMAPAVWNGCGGCTPCSA